MSVSNEGETSWSYRWRYVLSRSEAGKVDQACAAFVYWPPSCGVSAGGDRIRAQLRDARVRSSLARDFGRRGSRSHRPATCRSSRSTIRAAAAPSSPRGRRAVYSGSSALFVNSPGAVTHGTPWFSTVSTFFARLLIPPRGVRSNVNVVGYTSDSVSSRKSSSKYHGSTTAPARKPTRVPPPPSPDDEEPEQDDDDKDEDEKEDLGAENENKAPGDAQSNAAVDRGNAMGIAEEHTEPKGGRNGGALGAWIRRRFMFSAAIDDDGVSERLRERSERRPQLSVADTKEDDIVSWSDAGANDFGQVSLDDIPKRHVFGGLNDATIHEILNEALQRRENEVQKFSDKGTKVYGLLPYDITAKIFTEVLKNKARRERMAARASAAGTGAVATRSAMLSRSASLGAAAADAVPHQPSRFSRIVGWTVARFRNLSGRRSEDDGVVVAVSTAPVSVPKSESREPRNARARLWPFGREKSRGRKSRRSSAVIFGGIEIDEATVAVASALAGEADDQSVSASAALATMAMSASARSARLSQSQTQEKQHQRHVGLSPTVAQLRVALRLAERIESSTDARDYVNTIGVGLLVAGTRLLRRYESVEAFEVLSRIAKLMPSARADMLLADQRSLFRTAMDTVLRDDVYFPHAKTVRSTGASTRSSARMRVAAMELIGKLVLDQSKVGREARTVVAGDREFTDVLQTLGDELDSLSTSAERNPVSTNSDRELSVASAARRLLGALGVNTWKPRVSGQRGLRVLCIDGGGTRAVMSFEMLKHLKRITGCEIHEMFDVICGTSTGGIVAASLGLKHKTVEEVETLYRNLIGKIFDKKASSGPKLLLTRAYYDTAVFERILKEECGDCMMLDSQGERKTNKVFVVSSIMSRNPKSLHLFRNYTYPVGYESRYEGTAEARVWEAMRASSAAPTYFSEVRVNGDLHADGAVVANNPTACAVAELKVMYPGVPIECIVSLGNGNQLVQPHEPDMAAKNVGWADVLSSIISSATSTEHTHHVLADILPSDVYFRLNPTTQNCEIDVTSTEQLDEWTSEANAYIAANQERFEELAGILRPRRTPSWWQRVRSSRAATFLFGANELRSRARARDVLYLPSHSSSEQVVDNDLGLL